MNERWGSLPSVPFKALAVMSGNQEYSCVIFPQILTCTFAQQGQNKQNTKHYVKVVTPNYLVVCFTILHTYESRDKVKYLKRTSIF